jgi:uncharacterized membrane protein YbhN (UPF0104 family)
MGDRPINLRSQLRVRTGIAALLSTLPGGIGAVEGSTMALLVAGGAEPASAMAGSPFVPVPEPAVLVAAAA